MPQVIKKPYDVVIVGAGLSGLAAAQKLSGLGLQVLLLEKSKGLGGRVATRRRDGPGGEVIFDHGAQFVRDPVRGAAVDLIGAARRQNLLKPWFVEGGRECLSSPDGLTQFAKYLSKGLVVEREHKVIRIVISGATAQVVCDRGPQWLTNRVVLSCPLPQSLEILRNSNLAFSSSLEDIKYAKALVGLFDASDDWGGLTQIEPFNEIQSVSSQISKGVSKRPAITVVMSPDFSESYFDRNETDTLHLIQSHFDNLSRDLKLSTQLSGGELKKWRYSHPLTRWGKLSHRLGIDFPIDLIGDAFGGPSVVGAIESGLSLV